MEKHVWMGEIEAVAKNLGNLNRLGVEGEVAVASALRELPPTVRQANGICSIAYVQPSGNPPVYTWPRAKDAFHEPSSQSEGLVELPFGKHEWTPLKLYRGSWGPVANVQFQPIAALMVRKHADRELWFVHLQADVSEQGNDAILQKMSLVEVFRDGRYQVHEPIDFLENAGGSPTNDWIMGQPIVSARGDIVALLPTHTKFEDGEIRHRYVVVVLYETERRFVQVDSFLSIPRVLSESHKDIEREILKYLGHFPDHVKTLPGDTFERIVAEILASHGFSDIQLNVRTEFGEIDILAFEDRKTGKGYIVECKQYGSGRKVTLREAHVLAMKTILMRKYGVEKGMLVTTSDFTGPARNLYDGAWGLELRAYDEVVEWLKTYKPSNRHGLFLRSE